MKITQFAIDRPVTTTMLFLALVIFGLMSYTQLAVNVMPDMKMPYVVINTTNFGATPEEIENDITDKIEQEIATINKVKLVQSYSMESVSIITVEFEMSKDPDKALSDVKEKLDLVIPELPKSTDKPHVMSYNPNDAAILNLVIGGNKSASEIYDYTDNVLKEKLLKINGVSKVSLTGGELREIKVLADKQQMYEMKMNLTDVASIIESINAKISGGKFTNEHRLFSVETGNKFKSAAHISDTYIPTNIGALKIGDFAMVRDSVKNIKSKSTYFDIENKERYHNIVAVGVMKKTTANSVEVAREVKALLTELNSNLPEGITVTIPYDDSKYIESSVNDALLNVILGIILTGFILLFFLGDVRTTLIVSTSIPVSLIATFLIMKQINASLNMMTLMSFSVAIGALISNSIVVIENILRLKKEGMNIKEASVKGTSEVAMAVIASTGTNLVVFLPIAMMSSMVGAFFKEYALTIATATVFSLIVSFMLTPMLTSILFRKERKESKFSGMMNRFFTKLENAYEKSLQGLISKKWKPMLLFALTFVVFIMSTGLLSKIGFEFEPKGDNGKLYVQLEAASGTAIHKTVEIIKTVEDKIALHPEVKNIQSNIGVKNSNTEGTNLANISIHLYNKEQRNISNSELAELIYAELSEMPEIIPYVTIADIESGAPLSFTLQSKKEKDLFEANRMLIEKLKSVPGLLNYESNYREGNQILHIEPKQHAIAELGISPVELAMAIRAGINGVKASVIKEDGKEYDIVVSYPEHQINAIEKINQIPYFLNGNTYTLEQLADISFDKSQAQIIHYNKLKTIEFAIIPESGVVESEAQKNVQASIDEIELPTSVAFAWSGNTKEMENTMTDILITFTIALLLMYMLLASLLESFWHPVIIFTTVPMAMIGVFVFMYLGGTTMNIMSLMAIITLLGLAVNDSILIYDYNEQLRQKGMKLREATLLAGKTKMKTVIMTTIAIVAGMLPNALGMGDAGAEYRTPMAVVTIGGILTSTILTLYLIPSLFYIIRDKKSK